MKIIELVGKSVGILVGLLYFLNILDNDVFLWTWFLIIMATVGIPHGAIDHLLYYSNRSNEINLRKFVYLYVGIMVSYLVCWYFLPVTSLILFLIISAYHFGQSHYLQTKVKRHKLILYLTTGFYYLAVILFGDFEKTSEILMTLVDIQFLQHYTTLIIGGFFIFSLVFVLVQPKLNKLYQLAELAILGLCLYHMPLLLAFITYFGFWHSLPSILEEYRKLTFEDTEKKATHFLRNLLPFSLVSMVGMGLILLIFNKWLSEKDLTMLFFVLVSLISAPHIWIMNAFLEKPAAQGLPVH